MEDIFILPEAEIKELNNASTFIIENNGDLNRGTIESLNTMLDYNKLKNAPVDKEYLLASFAPDNLEYSQMNDQTVGIYELDLSILEKYNVDYERDLFKIVVNDSIIIVEPSKLTMLAYSLDTIMPVSIIDNVLAFGILDNYLIISAEVMNLFDFDVTKIELFKYEKVNKNELSLKTINIYKNSNTNISFMKESIEYDSIVGDITIFYENLTFSLPVNKLYYGEFIMPYAGNIKGVLTLSSGEDYILPENELPVCLSSDQFTILDSALYDKDINFYIQYSYTTNQYHSHINLSEITSVYDDYWSSNTAQEFLNIQKHLLKGFKCFDASGKEIISCFGSLTGGYYNYIYQGQNIYVTLSDAYDALFYQNNIIIEFYDNTVRINGKDYNCTIEQDENNNLTYNLNQNVFDYNLSDTNVKVYHNNRCSTLVEHPQFNYTTKINFIDYTITLNH